jgi:hypothetical protein
MTLHWAAASAPPATRHTQILPMNHPITFGMKGRKIINLQTAIRHYVSQRAVQFMHRSLWFLSSRQQLSAPLAICSWFQSVGSVVCHNALYFREMCISVCHLCKIWICLKVSAKISWWNNSQHTIHNLVNNLRTTELLTRNKNISTEFLLKSCII